MRAGRKAAALLLPALLLLGVLGLAATGCDHFPGNRPLGPAADARIVRSLCTSDLGGPNAKLQLWRDDSGRITIYELEPDPQARAKASAALYDSRGREQLRLPPVDDPGSPQALEVQRRREVVFEDSKQSETIDCKADGGR